MPINLNKFW